MMAKPTRSFPRRPARPAICWISPIVKSVKSRDFADAGLRDDDGSRRKIDSGGQGGRGKDGIEAAMCASVLPPRFSRRADVLHDAPPRRCAGRSE